MAIHPMVAKIVRRTVGFYRGHTATQLQAQEQNKPFKFDTVQLDSGVQPFVPPSGYSGAHLGGNNGMLPGREHEGPKNLDQMTKDPQDHISKAFETMRKYNLGPKDKLIDDEPYEEGV